MWVAGEVAQVRREWGRKGSQEMMTKPGKTTDGNTGMLFSDAIADVKQPANKGEDGYLPQGKWGWGNRYGGPFSDAFFFS